MNSGVVDTVLDSMDYKIVNVRQMFGAGSELASGDVCYTGGYREATVDDMFGSSSIMGSYEPITQLKPMLIDGWLFQLLVVIGFVAYLYILWRSWTFMGSIWSGFLFGRGERNMRDEGGELPLKRFKLAATALGLMLLALVVVRFIDLNALPDAAIYDGGVAWFMPIYALLAILMFVAWQYGLHKIVGVVIRSEVMSEIAAVGVMSFVRCVAVIYPLVGVWLLAPIAQLSIWSIVLSLIILLILIIYLKDTFLLFVGKKISILNWILYLCAAILLPISFLGRVIPDIFG